MVIEKELLTNLGITKAEAWIVEILSDGQPHTQRDLERATDLERSESTRLNSSHTVVSRMPSSA